MLTDVGMSEATLGQPSLLECAVLTLIGWMDHNYLIDSIACCKLGPIIDLRPRPKFSSSVSGGFLWG